MSLRIRVSSTRQMMSAARMMTHGSGFDRRSTSARMARARNSRIRRSSASRHMSSNSGANVVAARSSSSPASSQVTPAFATARSQHPSSWRPWAA
jgi:hypothetical protein